MRIGLDYDETFTKDPVGWRKFIDLMQLRDHEVMIVTFRDPSLDVGEMSIPVFYTSYKAKRKFMESQGIYIDVWIDDSPETIVSNSTWSDEDRERWREEHYHLDNLIGLKTA